MSSEPTTQITVRLPNSLLEQIGALTDESHKRADVVRILLRQGLMVRPDNSLPSERFVPTKTTLPGGIHRAAPSLQRDSVETRFK